MTKKFLLRTIKTTLKNVSRNPIEKTKSFLPEIRNISYLDMLWLILGSYKTQYELKIKCR